MTATRSLRARLAMTTVLAGAVLVLPAAAAGQTYNGFGTVTGGSHSATASTGDLVGLGGAPNITSSANADGGRDLKVTLNAQNTVIEWNSLNVPQHYTANFSNNGVLTTGATAVLNRVTVAGAANLTKLEGTITADHGGGNQVQVWFINTNGIMIGNGATFNTAGLVLSTLNLTNDNDFLNGGAHPLSNDAAYDVRFAGTGSTAAIVGGDLTTTITTNNGLLALIAPTMNVAASMNTGRGAAAFALASDVSISTTVGGPLSLTLNAGTNLSGTIGGAIVGNRVYALLRPDTVMNNLLAVDASVTNATVNATGVVVLSSGSGSVTSGGDTLAEGGTATAGTGDARLAAVSLGGGTGNLTVGASGVATLNGAITGAGKVSVTGTAGLHLNNDVTSSNVQVYGGPVTLGADATLAVTGAGLAGNNIAFNGAINGAHALTVEAGGTKSFGGSVGGTQTLTSLTSSGGGGTTFASGTPADTLVVKTSAGQSYDAVTLGNPTNFSGTTGDFGDITGGGNALGLAFSTSTSLGTVAGLTTLTSTGAGPVMLNGNVTSTGTQSYGSAVVLGADVTANAGAGDLSFGTVTGKHALVANSSGTTSFGAVGQGAGNALTSLTTGGGGTTTLGGNVTTDGVQRYQNAVVTTPTTLQTLRSNNNALISFAGTLNGTAASQQSLLIATTGGAAFAGTVGTTRFASLETTGPATIGADITADQATFGGAVTLLNGTRTITGATTFKDTVGAAGAVDALVLTGGAGVALKGIGTGAGVTPLASLNTSSSGFDLTGNVTTTATQAYTGPVTIHGNSTLTGTTASFGGTVVPTGTAGTLTLDLSGAQTLAGGTFGAAGNPFAGIVVGPTNSTAGAKTLTGTFTVGNGLTVNDAALASGALIANAGGGGVAFNNTLNGTTAGADSVTVNTGGATVFGKAVGTTTRLAALTTDTPGTLSIGGDVDADTQSYGENLTLTGTGVRTFTAATDLAFAGTVTGADAGLSLAGAGTKSFGGAVSLGDALTQSGGQLTVNTATVTSAGTQTYADVALGTAATLKSTGGGLAITSLTGNGNDLTLSSVTGTAVNTNIAGVRNLVVQGPATLSGTVATTGTQDYQGNTTLGAATTVTSTGLGAAGNIGFAALFGTTDGGQALTVTTAGTTTFGGAVGTAGGRLASVTTSSGPVAINGGSIITSGAQSYGGAVSLGADTALTGTSIGFGTGITGNNHDLTLSASAAKTIDGSIFGIRNLTVTGGGATTLNGPISTSGFQRYDDAVTLGAAPTTLTSTGGGAITLASTLDGNQAFATSTTGTTFLNGTVGGMAPLASIAIAGPTSIGAAAITTAGIQSYTGAVTLAGAGLSTLTSTGNAAIGFGGTVAATLAGGQSLAVVTTGTTTFGGAVGGPVGGTAVLGALSTSTGGTTAINGGSVNTTNAQTYGTVTLGANTVLTSSNPTSVNSLVGVTGNGNDLALNFAGDTSVSAAIAGVRNLSTGNGGRTLLSGTVTTSGAQTYNDATTLSAATQLISTGLGGAGDVTFANTLDGNVALTVQTAGATTFGGVVGGTGAGLGSIAIDGPGVTRINTTAITTSGSQAYTAITLGGAGAGTTLTGTTLSFTSLAGAGKNLTLTMSGNATLGTSVTNVHDLASNGTGSTTITGSISTTGHQTYANATTLTGDATLASSDGGGDADITFGGTLNGAANLTVDTAGTTFFNGAVGAGGALASITTDGVGKTSIGTTAIRTTGNQTYGDAVVLATAGGPGTATLTSTGGGAISFAKTVDATTGGGQSLTVATGGVTTFGGAVGTTGAGGSTNLYNLTTDAGGSTAINGGAITTTNLQSYGDPVTLGANTVLTAAGINYAGGINGNSHDLTLTISNPKVINSSLTGIRNLLVNGGGATTLASSVSTSGTQTYADAVTLGAGAPIVLTSTGTGAAGDIGFGATLDGGQALGIVSQGTTSFAGAVGGIAPLAALTTDSGGRTAINGGAVTTTGAQTYGDAVVLGNGDLTTLASTGNGAISFNGTLDALAAGTQRLTVTTGGLTSFTGTVGGGAALKALVTDAAGSTAINADRITTTGLQSYGDPVVLGRTSGDALSTLVSTGGGAIGFGGTVNAATAGTQGLAVATGGTTTFTGLVGGAAALASLTTDAGGTTAVNGGGVITTGAQGYGDQVTLTPTVAGALTTFRGGSGAFTGGLLGNGNDVAIEFGGTTTIDGGSFTGVGNLRVGPAGGTAGASTLLANTITTTGTQTFNDAITLTGGVTLASTGSGAITFNKTIDATTANSETLAVDTAGATTFNGIVGGSQALGQLTTDSAGSSVINADAKAATLKYRDAATIGAGVQTLTSTVGTTFGSTVVGPGALILAGTGAKSFAGTVGTGTALASLVTSGGPTTLGGDVTTVAEQTYGSDVVLGAIAILASTGNADIGFAGTVDAATAGAQGLTVNTTGATTFGAAVGDTARLANIATNAGGSTAINGRRVSTTGAQSYGDQVTLGDDTVLTGSTGSFFGVTGNGHDLTLNFANATTLNGDVLTGIRNLTTDTGGGTTLSGTLTTSGAQTYNDQVTLSGPTALTATSGAFNAGLVGVGNSLTLGFSGSWALDDTVTGLGSLTTTGIGTAILSNALTTAGDQIYNTAVRLASGSAGDIVALTSAGNGAVTFANTVDATVAGTQGLSVTTGGLTTFGGTGGGTVGGSQALASLTTDAAGSTAINTSVNAATQSYADAATIGAGTQTLTAATSLAFGGTVNGPGALIATGAGTKSFAGSVGAGNVLASLTTSGGATTLGGNVSTGGAQSYGTDVVLGNTITVAAGGNAAIDFAGKVDATAAGGQGLTVATGGVTSFGGAVGGTALASLVTDAGGSTLINGGSVTTSGGQTYNDAVTLGAATQLRSTGSGDIGFVSTLDGGQTLNVLTAGTTTFGALVGGTAPLASLMTDADGTTVIGTTAIKTMGDQVYGDAVKLAVGSTLSSSGAGTIRFDNTVNGPQSLAVNTGGATIFGGAVGNTAALLSLTTDAGGTTAINGGIAGGNYTVSTTGAQTYNDAVTIGADARLISTNGGALTFNDTVDGGHVLSLTTNGAATANGVIGGSTALTGLALRTGSFTALNGNRVGTLAAAVNGPLSYDDAAALTVGTVDGLSGIATGTAPTTVSAGGLLTLATNVAAGNTSLTGLGITQAAGTSVNAGAGTIALDGRQAAVTLAGTLTTGNATANAVGIVDAGNVALGNIVTGAAGTTTLGGSGTAAIAGSVTQTAGTTINTGTLVGTVGGTATIANAGNSIATLGALSTNGLTLRDSRAGLTAAGPIGAGTGNLALALDSGTLGLAGTLTAASGTVTLTSGGTISQSAGNITADTLTGSAVGGASLASTGNAVNKLAGFTNAGSGALTFTDSKPLTVTGDVSSAGDATVNAVGIDFTGRTIKAAGALTLAGGTGAVTGGTATGGTNLTATAASLNIGTATAGNGTLALTATGAGGLTVGTASATGAATLSSQGALTATNSLTSTTGAVTVTATGAATLGQTTASSNVAVTANGITAGATKATGGTLTLTSGGGINLASGQAGSDATFDANGTAALGAVTAGASSGITVRALDAAITGAQTASKVAFVNKAPATVTFKLGDNTSSGGFALSQAEVNQVNAGTLTFDGGTGNIELGALAFANAAGGNAVTVLSTGRINVVGAVSGTGAGRLFRLGGTSANADDKAGVIEVAATATGGGSLQVGTADLDLRGGRIGVGQAAGFLTPLGFDAATGLAVGTVASAYVGNATSSLYNSTYGGAPYASTATLLSAHTLTVRYTDYALFQNTGAPGTNAGVVLGGTTAAPVANALVVQGAGSTAANAFALFGSINGVTGTATALLGSQIITTNNVNLINTRVNGCLVGSGAGCLTSVVSQPVLNVFDSSSLNVFRSADDLAVPFDPVIGSNNEALFSGVDQLDVPITATECAGHDDPQCRAANGAGKAGTDGAKPDTDAAKTNQGGVK